MKPTELLQGRRVRGPSTSETPRIRLSRRDESSSVEVDGADLERVFQLSDGRFLVFLTDDSPFEETLRLLLLSPHLRILDGMTFDAAYATAALENIRVVDPEVVEFSFIHKIPCRIRVCPTPRWRAPLLKAGVSRVGSIFRRRLLEIEFATGS